MIQFNPKIAVEYGVDEAIVYERMKYLCEHNAAHDEFIYDGNAYCFATVRGLTRIYPFWSKHQVERIIESMVKKGMVVKRPHWNNIWDQRSYFRLLIEPQEHTHGVSRNGDRVSRNGDTELSTKRIKN